MRASNPIQSNHYSSNWILINRKTNPKCCSTSQVLTITAPQENPNRITLGRIFLDLHHLEEVHITYSTLPAIGDSSFWPGRALKNLNLSHNSITIVRDSDFNGLDSLLVLDLSDNKLSRAPSAAFRHLTNLTWLSLAGNQFTKLVPRLFFKLAKLEFLDLSRNPLNDIHPDDFKDITNLSRLNLRRCQLTSLHSLVYRALPNLTYLDLSDNRIAYFTAHEFASLLKLKELRLNGNKVSVLSDNVFSGLQAIDFLDLSSNLINSMSSCTFCNSSITRLDISNNTFTSFQYRVLEPLTDSLTVLEANANKHLIDPTTSVAYLIQPLKRLTHLSVTFNSLDDSLIDSTFYNSGALVHLNMSYNRFVNISGRLFIPLTNLEVLDLSHNRIFGLDSSFFDQISAMPTLREVYWNDNPWSCYRCNIMGAREWLNRSPAPYLNVCHRYAKDVSRHKYCIKCTAPGELSGKYLHLVDETELEWCLDPRVQLRLTASEPQIGLILAIFIILSLLFVIIAVIVVYRKQGAVYYTHEDDRFEEKSPVAPVFSVASNTAVKQPLGHCPLQSSPYGQYARPPSPHSTPTMCSSLASKPDSPKAGPSVGLNIGPTVGPSVPTITTSTATTMRVIRPKVQIYI